MRQSRGILFVPGRAAEVDVKMREAFLERRASSGERAEAALVVAAEVEQTRQGEAVEAPSR